MNGKFKKLGLLGVLASVAILATSAASASSWSLTTGGTALAGQGLTTSVVGATVVDFNSSFTNPAGYTGGAVHQGSINGSWASPPGDTSKYFSVGPGPGQTTPATILLGSLSKYFGFFGGSPDVLNGVELWRGDTKLKVYTGTDLAAVAGVQAVGDWGFGAYWNIWALDGDSYFDKILLTSENKKSFETDNHASLATPLPAAIWLFGSALFGFISLSNRRRV